MQWIIQAKELKRAIELEEDDLLLVHVRDEESFERGRILDSHNVPADRIDFVTRVTVLGGGRHRCVVLYGEGDDTDTIATAAHALVTAGFRRVARFEDGMTGWKDAGFPVEAGAAVTYA